MATPVAPSELCESCRRIEFNLFLPLTVLLIPDATGLFHGQPHIRNADGTVVDLGTRFWHRDFDGEIGSMEDIMSRRKECPLCEFLAVMFDDFHRKGRLTVQSDSNECSVYITTGSIGSIQDHTVGRPYDYDWDLDGWQLISMNCAYVFNDDRESHEAFLAAPSSTATEPTLLGRIRPALCDVSQFKRWLGMCTECHAECSQTSITRNRFLRLIDVVNSCLVQADDEQPSHPDYLALSYVWGHGSKDHALTKQNLRSYSRHNGLPMLPRTIADAISLTRKLGIRYLWIDSLCIISDDAQDKVIQIPRMKSIYGCALLTIIAAAGQHADYGLPGLHVPRPEMNVAEFQGWRIVQSAMSDYKKDYTSGTTWASRAWTFQEFLLSPRSLIFLDEQVIWHCKSTEWLEELNIEDPNMFFHWRPRRLQRWTDLSVSNYNNLVASYTERELTYEEDVVSAFSGIIEAIPHEFFWGIPYENFAENLFWKVGLALFEAKSPQRRDCGLRIPSWSWFGWRVTIARGGPRDMISSISVYRWRAGYLEQICTPRTWTLPDISIDQRNNTIWHDETEWTVSLDDIPKDVTLNEYQIIFWTFVVPASTPETGQLALIGTSRSWIQTLRITWSNGVARREACERFEVDEWLDRSPVRKLIIME